MFSSFGWSSMILLTALILSAAQQGTPCIRFYKVQKPETCSSIASSINVTEPELRLLNPGLNCSQLLPGQELCTAQNITRKRKVFLEYLGAEGYPVTFNQPPINPDTDFYFILSFAVDSDSDGNPRNGEFTALWSDSLDPRSVRQIKAEHPNVKVLMSLAGWSVSTRSGKDKVLFWYDPEDLEVWIQNAYKSIEGLVRKFSLDGIDVDYESFRKPGNTSFPRCFGELITRLKRDRVVEVVTIAPFEDIEEHYLELFSGYRDWIDLVNYQFYTTHRAPSVEKFVRTYMSKAGSYGVDKTLVSLQIRDRGIQGEDFFTGVREIVNQTNGGLPGIMIWSLDMSVHYKTNFWYENQSQAILAAL